MKWLYYIPHEWADPKQKKTWEDIYLMPEVDGHTPDYSLWLTVDGYHEKDTDYEEETWFEEDEYKEFIKKGYLIRRDIVEIIIESPEFDKEELLHWAKVYLEEGGFEITELVESTWEQFLGTNEDIIAVEEAIRRRNECLKNPEKVTSWEEFEKELKP